MSSNESVAEFSEVLSPYFPPPISWTVRVGEGGCSGGDTQASLSYPVFPLSLNVVNECCMKSLRPASCWIWTEQSVLWAPATTTTTKILTVFKNSFAASSKYGHWRKYVNLWVGQPNFSTIWRNWYNSKINVSLMWAQLPVIFTVPNQFNLHLKFLKHSAPMFIVFWTT